MPSDDRPDLAAMVVPLGRALVAAEVPVLRAHSLTMWGYIALCGLDEAPLRTQAALAQAIGADKTRLIGVLDDLQERGLIRREPDPADRRAHLLSVTPKGRRVRDAARAGIRRREDELLARLSPGERRAFLRALRTLAGQAQAEPGSGGPARADRPQGTTGPGGHRKGQLAAGK